MRAQLLPMGERALLVEVEGIEEVLALTAALSSGGPDGAPVVAPTPGTARRTGARDWPGRVTEVVPAARTVLVRVAHPADLPAVRDGLSVLAASVEPDAGQGSGVGKEGGDVDPVVIRVTYDGPDLAEVARLAGLAVEEVVHAHSTALYRVAFVGFAPGFAYLVGGDPRLEVPRRSTPRSTVPAGSVGLAGPFTGIYPRSSPGGWQLIGRTDAVLWDIDRDPPALLTPGATVRFQPVDLGRGRP